jgi:hypothetical protein
MRDLDGMKSLVSVVRLCALVVAIGCDDHDHDRGFDTFKACFDEHHTKENYDAAMSIAICTLDHPIDDHSLEFATVAECVAYVDAELEDADATALEIMAGCTDYITQKDM